MSSRNVYRCYWLDYDEDYDGEDEYRYYHCTHPDNITGECAYEEWEVDKCKWYIESDTKYIREKTKK